jgi:AraC-like DNA-binding protein
MRDRTSFVLYCSEMAPDPLSDVLALLKPRNVACGAVDAGEGCLAFPGGGEIKCHAVTEGRASFALEGGTAAFHLEAGEAVLLPHGSPYRIASDLGLAPSDYRSALDDRLPGRIATWRGGGCATIVTAAFSLEERHAGLLRDILPTAALLIGSDARAFLARTLEAMMGELREPQPGARVILEHLATTLLVQALRAYLAQEGEGRVGWLFALRDRKLGLAIAAMHDDPARRWTVKYLAEIAGMSRTIFAMRFRGAVGVPPAAYLTQLRLRLASERLRTSDATISSVAQELGYASESAFSHAFKRCLGQSPRRYSKAAAQAGGSSSLAIQS